MGRLFLPNIKMLSGKSLSIKKSNALSHTSFFLLMLWGPIVGLRPPGPSLSGSFKQGMLGKEERQANYAKKLPYNFSWIEPRRLAGTSIPSTVAQLEGLVREGESHLVSLSPETPPPTVPVQGLTVHFIPIEDFQAPTPNQIDKFLEIADNALEDNEAVAVHCRGGNGRTGTMLAAFWIREKHLRAETAVAEVRKLRPGAVESWVQEQALASFHRKIVSTKDGG